MSKDKFSEITLLLVGLEEMLRMHRNLETDIFYPWFDDSLDLKERERVLKILTDRKDKISPSSLFNRDSVEMTFLVCHFE